MSRKAGFTDSAAGAGVLEALVNEFQGGDSTTLLQAMDLLSGGAPLTLRTVSGSVTPPTVTANTPAWHVIARRVPDDQFWVIDYMTIQCSVADESWARLSRRYVLGGNVAAASPSAPAAPTVAAVTHDVGIDEANGANGFSYKYTWLNTLGQESLPSVTSSTVTPTAAQKRIDITVAALPGSAVEARLYRSRPGVPAGPWFLLDHTPGTSTYRDVHPDGDLDLSIQPPGAATWGNAFTGEGPMAGPGSLIYVCTAALAAAPTHIVYTNQRNRRSSVAFAPGTAATQLRVALSDEGRYWANLSAIGTHMLQQPFIPDYGATDFIGFNNTKAVMGGSWVVYGIQPHKETHFEGAIPIAGGNAITKFRTMNPLPFPPGSTIVIEAGGTAAQAPGTREITAYGRSYALPT